LRKVLGNPDVIVVDVRQQKGWNDSDLKIKGAIRENPDHIKEWMKRYPRNKTLVFYCA